MVALLGKLMQDGQEAAVRRRDFHRTCFRAVAQIPFDRLMADRRELESLNEKVGVDGAAAASLTSSPLTLAFSLVTLNQSLI